MNKIKNGLSGVVSDSEQAMSIKYNTIVYELQRSGKKVTVMSLGEAFFDIPLFDFDDLPFPQLYHYSHSRGLPELRKKLSEFFLQTHNMPINYETEILITAGSKAAIHFALMAILNPGDEVIVPEPAWVSYPEQIKLCYGKPVQVPYYKNIYEWENYISDRTKAIIINNPHNPSGYTYSKNELEYLLKLAEKYNLWILSDEAYSEFAPDDSFISLGSLDRQKKYSIIFNSISKNYGISGWRLGYVIANEQLVFNILKVNQHIITCPATILEYYVLQYFHEILDHTIPQIKQLLEKRKEIALYMDSIGLKYLDGNATFYFFVSIAPSQLSSEEFTATLLQQEYISVVPGIGYGDSCDKFIRVSIGTSTVEEAKSALLKIRNLAKKTAHDGMRKISNVLIIAGGKWQLPLIRFMQNKGHRVHVADPYTYSDGVQIADSHISADVRDVEKIYDLVKGEQYEFVTSDQSDISVNPVAILSEKLNLNGNSFQTTSLFTNKYLMHQHAQKLGIDAPSYRKIFDLNDLSQFIDDVGLPIIIKPADSQSSRGLKKIDSDNIDQINSFFTESLRYSSCGYILAEKYVEGLEITVEGFCSDGKHRSLCQSSKTHFRTGIASSLEYPALIPEDISKKIESLNDSFVDASGLTFGITHAEYMVNLNNGKINLIEIAARGGGTLISSDIIHWVTGIDIYEHFYTNLMGKKIDVDMLQPLKRNAILHFFEFPDGIVKSIQGIEKASSIAGVHKLELLIKEGDQLIKATDDRSRHGYVIILTESKAELDLCLKQVIKDVEIEYV